MPRLRPVLGVGLGLAASLCNVLALPAAAAPAPSDRLPLPRPAVATLTFPHLGLRHDRRLVSRAPGTARTSEQVQVAVDGGGVPTTVSLDERIAIRGTGDYLIYERGPARASSPLGDSPPPVLKLGTVLWQGFSPGRRDLAARLTLDPELEAARLPMQVTLTFHATPGGPGRPLGPHGTTPGPGQVTVHLQNATATPVTAASGRAAPSDTAPLLARLRRTAQASARHPDTPVLVPVAGRELPLSIPGVSTQPALVTAVAPLRVSGTITATGGRASLAGPTVAHRQHGGRLDGVLIDGADFTLTVADRAQVSLDLTAVPTVDPRGVTPPQPSTTWSAWARSGRAAAEAAAVTGQLIQATANSARAAELSPYVGSDLRGPATTAFHYRIDSAAEAAAPARDIRAHPLALTMAAIAAVAIAVIAALVWRQA